MFADAVHPTPAPRPRGCWGPKDSKVAVDQTSGRQRMNLHGAIDLETGQTHMREVLTVDAMSTIALVMMGSHDRAVEHEVGISRGPSSVLRRPAPIPPPWPNA